MARVINQTRFSIGNRRLLSSHTDFTAGIMCNSNYSTRKFRQPGLYCSCQSRFWPSINTTLLTSSRLHSHLHPPLARPLSLKSLPWCCRSTHAPTRGHNPPRTLTRIAAKRTPTHRRTRLRRNPQLWIGFGASTIFVYGSCCRRLRKPGKWRSIRRWRRRKPKEAAELWGRARHRVEEVYEDGYFTRKVIGARHLIAVWRWADKL